MSQPHGGGGNAGSGGSGNGSGNGGGQRPRPNEVKYVVAKRADVLRGGLNKQAFELICPGDVLRVHRMALKNRSQRRPRAGWALVTLYYAAESLETPAGFDSVKGYDASKQKSPREYSGSSPGAGGAHGKKGWTRISVFRGASVAGYAARGGGRFTKLNRHEPIEVWAKRVEKSSQGPNRLLEYIPCLVTANDVEFLRFIGKDSASDLHHRVVRPEGANYPLLQAGHVVAVARKVMIPRSTWLAKIDEFFDAWAAWVKAIEKQRALGHLPAAPPDPMPPGVTHLDWFRSELLDKFVPKLSKLRNQYTHFGTVGGSARIVKRNGEQYVAVLGRAKGSSAGECAGFGYIKLADFAAGKLIPVTQLDASHDRRRQYWRVSGASPSSDSHGNQPGTQLVYPSRSIAIEFNKFIDDLFNPDGSLQKRPDANGEMKDRSVIAALFSDPIEHKRVNLVPPGSHARAQPAQRKTTAGFAGVVAYYVKRRGREPRST